MQNSQICKTITIVTTTTNVSQYKIAKTNENAKRAGNPKMTTHDKKQKHVNTTRTI